MKRSASEPGFSVCETVKFLFDQLTMYPVFQSESVQSRKPDASWYYDFSEPIENDRARVSRVRKLAIILSLF